jgi:GNAT superfamily N-acetyltransferase
MKLRPYNAADVPLIARLYHETIHTVNLGDYTREQVDAWAPEQPDLERWGQKLATEEVVVAELAGEIVGFCSWDPGGYLDFLYVHHAHQRKGVAAALYTAAESAMRVRGLRHIHTQASITAQPFFLRQGFRVVRKQLVQVRGVELPNAVMEKILV